MAKAVSKRRSGRKTASGASTRKRAKQKKSAEERAFIDSLTAHGQAVKIPPGGQLPPEATHELVEDKDGELRLVRKRFSAF